MPRPRRSQGSRGDGILRRVASLAIVLRAEADRLDQLGIKNEASELGKISVENEHATTAYVIRSLANWIEKYIRFD